MFQHMFKIWEIWTECGGLRTAVCNRPNTGSFLWVNNWCKLQIWLIWNEKQYVLPCVQFFDLWRLEFKNGSSKKKLVKNEPPEHHRFESQPRSSPAFLGNWGRRWRNLGLQAESAAVVMFLSVVSLFKGRLGDVRDLTGARQRMLFEKNLCLLRSF